jgi:8-oxo-dGTP diphosphatase
MNNTEEKEFMKNYNASLYPRPSVAVDLIICTMINAELHILLIERDDHPFKGLLSLPGGFVQVNQDLSHGEDLDETAARILTQKTHIPIKMVYLEQLYTFGNPTRDPRTRVISVAYFALIPPDLNRMIELNADLSDQWIPIYDLIKSTDDTHALSLAFDHTQMIRTMMSRLETKLDFSDIAFALVPKSFTVSELRVVYENIKDSQYDSSNFRRRFKRWIEDKVIEQVSGKRVTGSRPAKVYQKM